MEGLFEPCLKRTKYVNNELLGIYIFKSEHCIHNFFYINNLPHFFFFFFFFFFPDDSFSSPSLKKDWSNVRKKQTNNKISTICCFHRKQWINSMQGWVEYSGKSQHNYSWTMTSHKKNRPSSPSSPSSSFSWSSKACCSNCFSTLLMTASPSPFAFSVNYNHTKKTQKYCDLSALLFNNN